MTTSHALAAVALCAAFAAPLQAQPRAAAARPTTATQETPMQAELEMMRREEAFRGTVDALVAAAASGDAARVEGMISPKMRAQAGAEAVARVVKNQFVPFFVAHPEAVGPRTITETTDQFGNRGFAYYLYATPRGGGERRPFVVYVVEEGGRPVVGNLLVDHHVEGRHR